MKRIILAVLCCVVLAQAAAAQAPLKLGVGAFAGLNYPIIQDDQSSGTAFGFKGRLKMAFLTLEPNVTFARYGDPDIDGVIDSPEGSKLSSLGLDAVLGSPVGGPGLAVLLFAGIGSYKIKNDQLHFEDTRVGYSGGLGLEFGVTPSISVEARGRFLVIPTEGDGSKKSALATAGLNYHFGL